MTALLIIISGDLPSGGSLFFTLRALFRLQLCRTIRPPNKRKGGLLLPSDKRYLKAVSHLTVLFVFAAAA